MQAVTESAAETRVVIVGVGLMGGSIAASLRQRLPGCRITGVGRTSDRLRQAQMAGLIDEFSTQITSQSCPPGCLAVVCLPVSQIAEAVRSLVSASSGSAVVTDVGSIKSLICQEVQSDPIARRMFVGAHPIAGSEQVGFESAAADLFVNRMCVVTPESADIQHVQRVQQFWRLIGCDVRLMSAEDHDRILALTSHLPHALASVTAACVSADLLPFAGTGYRDTTRIAAGDAELWVQILCGNQRFVAQALESAEEVLRAMRRAIVQQDAAGLRAILKNAAAARKQYGLPTALDE